MKSLNNSIFIFLGPPGSGKGSLSKLCSKRLGWIQFSTGNLCRDHISKQTEIGKKIDFIIKSGKLISDNLVVEMVENWLDSILKEERNIIFDGFPRTKSQAKALKLILNSPKFSSIKLKIVKLKIVDKSIILRLSARAVCVNKKCQMVYSLHKDSDLMPKDESACDECSSSLSRRSDDYENAILERLKVYRQHEQDIINFFEDINYKVDELVAEQPLENVYSDLLNKIGF